MNFSQYLSVIKTNPIRKPVFKIELLRREDESAYAAIQDDVSLAGGSIEISLNQGTRRSLSLELMNNSGQYTDFLNNMKLGTLFKIYLGIKDINFGTIYFPQGVFVFTEPSINRDIANQTITINATDKWAIFDGTVGGNLQSTYTFSAGTKISSIVNSLLALDIVGGTFKYNISPEFKDSTIPFSIEKRAGDTIGSILTDIAYTINAQIYFDEYGILNITPYSYDFIKESMHTFSIDTDINYKSIVNNILYSELYNAVFVVADNYQNEDVPIYAEMLNDDLSDPNSVPNLGFIKYKQISDYIEGISTYDLALERCRYELKIATSKQSSVSITTIPLYHLDVNQCVTVNDARAGVKNQRYIIQSISLPISPFGEMVINASKATTWL